MNLSFKELLTIFHLSSLLNVLVVASLAANGTVQQRASMLPQTSRLILTITDERDQPVIGARCALLTADERRTLVEAVSDDQGHASFTDLKPGVYTLRVVREGFAPLVLKKVVIEPTTETSLSVILSIAPLAANVTVNASNTLSTEIEAGATITNTLMKREELRFLPIPAQRVFDALPLTPGVIRSPKGELSIKGAQESQSALIVNGVHANDPATGNFRLNLPLDSVEEVQVFQHPYTVEYGRFIGGITQVITKRGGESFHWELNDFLPDFRFKGGKLVGVAEDAPRLTLSGPIIKDKLFFAQSASYTMAKNPVRGLTFPDNETKIESQSYFSQFDLIINSKHTQTITIGYFPEHDQFLTLNFFRPRPVTPNYKQRDFSTALRDNYALFNGLLESTVSYKKFNAEVWGQGQADHDFFPIGESGNYFAQQKRHALSFEFFEVYQAPPLRRPWNTLHELKFGFDFIRVSAHTDYHANPVNIFRGDGTLAERIVFDNRHARPISVANYEYSGFIQDRLHLRANLSLDLGLRYENQRINVQTNLAPRAGFAWAPFKDGKTVVRGGIGVFFDKVPLNIRSFSFYPGRLVTRYATDGPTIIDRRYYRNVLVNTKPVEPFDLRRRDPDAGFVPENLTWNLELARQVSTCLLLRINYLHSATESIYILNPETDFRGQTAIVLRSAGEAQYRAFEIMARFKLRRNDLFYVSYVRSRARGDLNDFNSYFGDVGAPIIRTNQYSNLPFDVPHRLLAWGTLSLPHRITIAPIIERRTGFPYSRLDAEQRFVGLRNDDATRFPPFFSLDLEATKTFQVTRKYGIRLALRSFNITNHFNPQNVHANIADPRFGTFFASSSRTFAGGFDLLF
jgi:hypothetical protein